MKRVRIVLLFFIMLFLFTGCSAEDTTLVSKAELETNEAKKVLSYVLDNQKIIITETQKAVYLKNYHVGEGVLLNPIIAEPKEYTFVDFDADGNDELVVNISQDYGAYLVLHYNGQDVFGYEFGIREFNSLKVDGSFTASGGAASNYYCTLSFEGNHRNVAYIAIKDSTMNRFEVNGEECSIEELNEYINDWQLKESVKWIEYNKTENDDERKLEEKNNSASSVVDSAKINLDKYVSVKFVGNDLAGCAYAQIDKEKFLLDNIDRISFNSQNVRAYQEMYGKKDASAATEFLKYVSISLTKGEGLSNGETVETIWNVDAEKIETYFIVEYMYSPQSYTVTGLTAAEMFDPFENIEVNFTGAAPHGEASVHKYGSIYGGTYEVYPNSSLKNGDVVTVTFNCDDVATMISRYGKYPASYERNYVVGGLNYYVQSVGEIESADFDKLIENAVEKIWVIGYGNYKDAKYCGNYFYTAKNKPAMGVHFLQWCGAPVGNAICFVFEHPSNVGTQEDSPSVYTVIALENLMLDEEGNFIHNKHEMRKIAQTYDSENAVHNAFVGAFDEFMYCSVNF